MKHAKRELDKSKIIANAAEMLYAIADILQCPNYAHGEELTPEFQRALHRAARVYVAASGMNAVQTSPEVHTQQSKNRALDTLSDVPDELRAVIARIIKDAFDCGFNATDEHAFWFFDGIAAADRALEDNWVSKP